MDDARRKRVGLAEIMHALFGAEARDAAPDMAPGEIRIPVHAADGLRTLRVSLSNLGAPARSRGGGRPRRSRAPRRPRP